MLLGNAGGLENIVLQLLRGSAGVEDKEGQQKHALILALQLLQKCLCVLTIGRKIRWNYFHVISGPYRLFLLLDLSAVELRDGVLHRLDGLVLIHRLDVHGHDLTGLHSEEIRQHPVTDVRGIDGQEAHCAINVTHLESAAVLEIQAAGGNEILHRKAGRRKPAPVKVEFRIAAQMKLRVHQLQPLRAVQRMGLHTEALEIIEQVRLDMHKPWLCCLHGLCVNAEGQELRLCKAVVSCLHLTLQHAGIFVPDFIKAVRLMRDSNAFLELLRIRSHVHETEFKVHRAVKEVQEGAPLLKDLRLILLLGQLVIDILELNGLCVVICAHTADPILKHPVKGNALLGGPRHTVIMLCILDDLPYFLLILCTQILRNLKASRLPFPERVHDICEQSFLPPVLPSPVCAGLRNSCPSGKSGPSGEGNSPG